MKKNNFKFLLAFTVAAFLSFAQITLAQEQIKLEWLPLPEAKKYQIEISFLQKKETPIVNQVVETPAVTATLKAGVYAYRVRTILADNVEGPWSDYLDFIVNASTIKALEPKNSTEFEITKNFRSIKLTWEPSSGENKYRVQITGPAGMKEYEANSTELEWKPITTGLYSWKVGFSNGSADVWSETLSFIVRKPKVVEPAAPKATLAQTQITPAPQTSLFSKIFQQRALDFKVWLGPVYSLYSGRYVDQSNSTTAITLSEVYGLSVMMRNKNEPQPLGLTIGADLSIKRQQMLRSTAALPTLNSTASYYWNSSNWQNAVYAGAGLKTMGFFIIDSTGNYNSETVNRMSNFVGVKTSHQLSPQFSLGLDVSAALESGGSSSVIEKSFNSSPSFQLMLTGVLQRPDRVWSLDVSIKTEYLSWSSDGGSASSLNNSVGAVTLGTQL